MGFLTRLFSVVFLLFALATPALAQVSPTAGPDAIQDKAQILSPPVLKDMHALIANDSRPIRLVIVEDRKLYGGGGSFTEYVDALAQEWDITTRPLAILLVHEIKSQNITVRLGQGYSRHDGRRAHAIINDVYQPILKYQLFNAAHSKGFAALIAQLPRVKSGFREKAVTPIPLTDTGAVLQDHIGAMSAKQIATLSAKLAAHSHNGQMVRLVMIPRYQDLSKARLLRVFSRNLAIQWGMEQQHNSVLLVFDAHSKTWVLRLGYGFSAQQKLQANLALAKPYQNLLQQRRYVQAHQTGLLAVLKVLGKRPVPPPVTAPPATGDLVQDSAGVMTPAGILRLNDQIKRFAPVPIRILTVKNYQFHSNSKDFQSYADSLMQNWLLDLTPNAILIVHDIQTKQIAVGFGPGYSPSRQADLRAVLQSGYAPGLNLDLMNAAHFKGLEALARAFETQTTPPAVKTQKKPAPNITAPTSNVGKVMIVIAVLMLLLAGVVIFVIRSHRNNTQGARERADRIAAWKRDNTVDK